MALLIDQNQVQHQPTFLKIAAFAKPLPIDTFKDWLLAHLLRSKKHQGNADVDFNSDPLYVVFNVDHANLLLQNITDEADHIGFFFGNNKLAGNKHQNVTCFMALTKKINNSRFDIITTGGQQVYEGGTNSSLPNNGFRTKINNYLGRIGKLRNPANPHRAEFNSYERNGVHYPLADFQVFITYIEQLSIGATKDKFKSFFVKRTDAQDTTTLVHSPFDFDVLNVLNSTRPANGDEVYDQGTGCCPI